MRSISQKILVDRLAHALKTRGVDLKRSAVLEIAAQAFGHANSDHLAAAAKSGELDPPLAERVVPYGTSFAWLQDPLTGSAFAFDAAAVGTAPGFVVSPYGSLLALPESLESAIWPTTPRAFVGDCVAIDAEGNRITIASRIVHEEPADLTTGDETFHESPGDGRAFPTEAVLEQYVRSIGWVRPDEIVRERDGERAPLPTDPWTVGTDDENRTYQQIGRARDIVRLDSGSTREGMIGLDKYGLERFSGLVDLDVDMNPFVNLTGMGVSLVDGRRHLTYVSTIEYDGHHMATAALAEMQSVAFDAAERLKATGCVLRWTDDPQYGNLDIELHIPEDAMADLENEEQLEEAILQLLGSADFDEAYRLKDVGLDEEPNEIAADGSVVHNPLPPVHVRYWTEECRILPTILSDREIWPDAKDAIGYHDARAMAFRDLGVEIPGHPERKITSSALAIVDGEMCHVVELNVACDPMDEHRRNTIARSLEDVQAQVGPLIERLGGTWILRDAGISMMLLAYLPVSLSERIVEEEDWKDALAHLFGDRRKGTVEARYEPQAWQNDYAVDVDPEGPTAIDITWEVLTMGRDEAESFQDNRDFTESLIDALMAPKWIRDRQGPSAIYARAAVDAFLRERDIRLED